MKLKLLAMVLIVGTAASPANPPIEKTPSGLLADARRPARNVDRNNDSFQSNPTHKRHKGPFFSRPESWNSKQSNVEREESSPVTVTARRDKGKSNIIQEPHNIQTNEQKAGKWARKTHFYRVWDQLKLNTDMEAEVLADKVMEMRIHGVDGNTIGVLATNIVLAKEKKEYEIKYLARMSRNAKRFQVELKRIQNDSHLSSTLNLKQQMQMALDDTLTATAINDRKKKRKFNIISQDSQTAPLATKGEVSKTIERVGRILKNHLKAKKLDFYKIPLIQLELETRDLKNPPDMTPARFTTSMYTYIRVRRSVDKVGMDTIRRNRKNEQTRLSKIARKQVAAPLSSL